jgi:hypothetical protein
MNDHRPTEKRKPLKPKSLILALAAIGFFSGGSIPERTTRKCRLPGCFNQTTHNGGYCCAEHHAEGTKK